MTRPLSIWRPQLATLLPEAPCPFSKVGVYHADLCAPSSLLATQWSLGGSQQMAPGHGMGQAPPGLQWLVCLPPRPARPGTRSVVRLAVQQHEIELERPAARHAQEALLVPRPRA